MKKIWVILCALGALSGFAALSGCEPGPPKDNTNAKANVPPAPAPPGGPGATK